MILLKAVLEISISLLEDRIFIQHWRRKRPIYYISSRKIIAFLMGINALQQRYFLDKNGVLFMDGKKMIDDHTLVALTIMIAETRSEEMEMMVTVILII